MAGTDLEVTQDGGILRLTLNRPGAGNALTGSMTTELVRILEETADSDEVRVVVLTAEGKDFCTGVDLREANAPRSSEKPRAGHFQRRIAFKQCGLTETRRHIRRPAIMPRQIKRGIKLTQSATTHRK